MRNYFINKNQLNADTIQPVVLAEMNFADGFLRLFTGSGEIIYRNNTYLGIGNLGAVSSMEESTELIGGGITLSLNSLSQEILQYAQVAQFRGRPIALHIALVDDAQNIIGDIHNFYNGIMDTATIDERTMSVVVAADHRLIDLERINPIRLTDKTQKARFPGDRSLEQLIYLINNQLFWGRASPYLPSAGGNTGGKFGNFYSGSISRTDTGWDSFIPPIVEPIPDDSQAF